MFSLNKKFTISAKMLKYITESTNKSIKKYLDKKYFNKKYFNKKYLDKKYLNKKYLAINQKNNSNN